MNVVFDMAVDPEDEARSHTYSELGLLHSLRLVRCLSLHLI